MISKCRPYLGDPLSKLQRKIKALPLLLQNLFKCIFIFLFCTEIVGPCSSLPCKNGATCRNEINSYQCDCLAGWTGVNCETGDSIFLSSAAFMIADSRTARHIKQPLLFAMCLVGSFTCIDSFMITHRTYSMSHLMDKAMVKCLA